MWQLLSNKIDPATSSTGAALLCTILKQHLSSRQLEPYSDILSWIILPILSKVATRTPSYDLETQTLSTISLWIVASSIATFCFFKPEDTGIGLFPALVPLLLTTQMYLRSITHNISSSHSQLFIYPVNVWGSSAIAFFVTVVVAEWEPQGLGIETIVFGVPQSTCSPTDTSMLAFSKALTWYFIIQTARHASWNTVTTTETFGIISTSFTKSSDAQSLLCLVACFFTLSQVILFLPRRAKAKSLLWAFSIVPLVPFLGSILATETSQSWSPLHSQNHPIEILTRNAKANFEGLLQKQSKNYTAAQSEYLLRYRVEPPPGFKAWYEFATSHQSPIIDEFDTIHHKTSPFLRMSGQEVLDNMDRAQRVSNSELWLCIFTSHQAETRCSHPNRTFDRNIQLLFDMLLVDMGGILPDVKFLVNHLDEPRVLLSPLVQGGGPHGNSQLNITNMSRRPVWDIITKFCSFHKGSKHVTDDFALRFITDAFAAKDLCQHPEYNTMHGLLISPSSFSLIEGLVPVFSTGSLSTMGDILYPSPAYIESEFQYESGRDVEWDMKLNNIYWAGSNTGGFAVDDQWRYYHRQRFVKLSQNLHKQQLYYLQEKEDVFSRVKSLFFNQRLFDVAFTRIFQCKRIYCRDQRRYFIVKHWADKDRALRSRLVFDIDGNGISGRYYKLLASKSVPLKQTILREWHDERLIPWAHYIPVSQSMEELPELIMYLTSTEAGQKTARKIAEQGRDWYFKTLRNVDRTIYTYRLLLELARLQDPKRPAGS